jgi:hypothetical protein
MMSWNMANYMPSFDAYKWGLMDWNGFMNPLASMIKCANAFTTVSEGYLEELFVSFRGLESWFVRNSEKHTESSTELIPKSGIRKPIRCWILILISKMPLPKEKE